ncbi:hypothetical protein ACI797_23080 [Geodermatophilus sp. SYSU D00691]
MPARLLRAGAFAGALVLGAAVPAAAAPAETPQAATDTAAPQTLCQVTDPRLAELSGLVVVGDRMVALDDGGQQLSVVVLDTACAVVEVRTGAVDPYDPEDLAVGADGTVWVADIGDNRLERPSVAVLALRPDGTTGVYRLTYPDGPHDAESLLLAPDGTPYLVTKEVLGASGLYRPTAPPADGGTVALERVGTVTFTLTGTEGGPVGRAGQLMATGGAVSRDGRLLALRTYTDAYVWPLSGSDVPGALAGEPVRVPLPPAPQGEAISFSADDRQLVVAGEGLPGDVTVVPTTAQLEPVAAAASAAVTGDPAGGPPTFTAALVAAAVATLVVGVGSLFRRLRWSGD